MKIDQNNFVNNCFFAGSQSLKRRNYCVLPELVSRGGVLVNSNVIGVSVTVERSLSINTVKAKRTGVKRLTL